MTAPLSNQLDWYKDAIIYELHVKAFYDANGDGIGDFRGLIEKLDYLQELGITAIWLLPFFPSPFRDDGYDISDYRNIHPAYGTLSDFRTLVRETHRRGMRLIVELVVNHTSDQHPWFQRARTAKPGTTARNFYVWSDSNEKYNGTRIIFTDTEKSNWTWDPVAASYYWHRFFSHQPDLNFDNPHVVRAVLNTMRFWAALGVDGFRLDAIPYLCEREGTSNENLPETHAIVKSLRAALAREYPAVLLLAEANQWPEDVKDYFGTGDECHMAFHFPLMPRIYMAIAREDRHPITDIMRQTPEIPESCQWAIFLRNHDELTLEMVTDSDRDYLWSTYAADRRARVNLGIRRRLAPLMQNDRRKIELMNALLLSLPGTPIIYYGDEVGMGDNIYLGDRDGVRTPMQWTPDRNGGFSHADPATLCLPLIMDAVYGYQAVSVEAHSRNLSSLLNWMKRLIGVRQSMNVFGRGGLTFLYPSNRAVIAYIRHHEDATVLCVTNLSRSAQAVELDLSGFAGRVPVELLGRTAFPVVGSAPYLITLQGHGFFWFQLTEPKDGAPAIAPSSPELITLVTANGLVSLTEDRNRRILESDVLPPYLRTRRWFAQKNEARLQTTLVAAICFRMGDREWYWAIAEARSSGAVQYSLPLADEWQVGAQPQPGSILAVLRRSYHEGWLTDALQIEAFTRGVLDAVLAGSEIKTSAGNLCFRPTPKILALPRPEKLVFRVSGQEQSNTSVVVEEFAIFKFYRRVAPGIHPEIEMGAFLTDAGYANAPAMLGSLHIVDRAGTETALGIVHALIRNQGDGWSHTLAYLDRFLEESRVASAVEQEPATEAHAVYLAQIDRLAVRTAEFHRALYVESGDPAFTVEQAGAGADGRWGKSVVALVKRALGDTTRIRRGLLPEAAAILDDLARRRNAIFDHVRSLSEGAAELRLSRCHGDYHLGQVLIVQNDVFIVDLEGAPQIPLLERRTKHSVIRDVACMLRSFDYAAWTALDRATTSQPDRRQELRQAIRLWREQVGRVFLDRYVAAMEGCPLWPENEALARRLLGLFMIEKAALEILYELGNRPNWVGVPLEGLQSLLPAQARSDGAVKNG